MPIIVRSNSSGVPVTPVPFAMETELQELLADSPLLLRQDGDVPLTLVDREVDLREAGMLDLLFVNADGLPVAVEVKLERNSEARREVVAQVVDYLSALTALTVELDERVSGKLEAALRAFSPEDDDQEFERRWRAVGANLRAGLARMVVALDGASSGLERIVRFLARNSELDVQLVIVERHRAPDLEQICMSTFLVSASSNDKHAESTGTRTPLPELIAAVTAFNESPESELRAVGIAANYRQIRPPDWPSGCRVHYEFVQTKAALSADLHIESDNCRPLAAELAPFAGKQVADGAGSIAWDANWSSRRGRLTAQFPINTSPATLAHAMRDLVRATRPLVASSLAALRRDQLAS